MIKLSWPAVITWICFWSENCCRQSADRRQQFSDRVLDRRQQFSDQIWIADSSFQTKFWIADSSFQTHGSYLVFKLSLWGQFSQKPGMLRIEWPIPLRRARSELSYGPACQKGFTSPLTTTKRMLVTLLNCDNRTKIPHTTRDKEDIIEEKKTSKTKKMIPVKGMHVTLLNWDNKKKITHATHGK